MAKVSIKSETITLFGSFFCICVVEMSSVNFVSVTETAVSVAEIPVSSHRTERHCHPLPFQIDMKP